MLSEAGKEEVTVSLENLQSNTDDIQIDTSLQDHILLLLLTHLLECAIFTLSVCHKNLGNFFSYCISLKKNGRLDLSEGSGFISDHLTSIIL